MMGKDCERILSSICKLKDSLYDCIMSVSSTLTEPITMEEHHIEGDIIDTTFQLKEKELDEESVEDLQSALSMVGELSADFGKMGSLEKDLYSGTTNFNNSYGSPWTELNKLNESITALQGVMATPIKFTSQKVALIAVMSAVMGRTVDAKWAIITYNDYIQRGFDKMYNDRNPSITTKRTINKLSVGNLEQQFDENVNIPEESIDPF